MGLAGISSRFGKTGELPYTDDEDAYTTRFTFASFAATNTFNVPVTFTSFVAIGLSTERATEGKAA